MKFILALFVTLTGVTAVAASNLEGEWSSVDGRAVVSLIEFDGKLTMNTRSYYPNGAPSDYFFEFRVPQDRDVEPGEILQGRLRSIDGYYGCVFDEPAKAQLTHDGKLKLHYPLLTFHRETRSVRQGVGRGYYREIDWTGWGWVERYYSFPIERYRVISCECVIDQRNWTTGILVPVGNTEIPVPQPE
ncbi:hypothetical protein QJS83_01445 [Bdellovibrio sp. 22V]|uniref:hypothetical protein n=1 Tax=Bdellovibrio TaxID=958 RepID=UPI0025430C66|nr:hypothetical protein [Bdellovibrio sp. 22V]WII72533.1 hypothetical protein QJS83_01445 [Bdellovibrio sp. 22V]